MAARVLFNQLEYLQQLREIDNEIRISLKNGKKSALVRDKYGTLLSEILDGESNTKLTT